MKKIIVFMIILTGLLSTTVSAMERFDVVTTVQIKQMLDDRAAGKIEFVLVNTLDEIIFRHSSIPGSINVPWYKIDKKVHKLGPDKNQQIITYCMGHR
ncbi:rhodanese-like domain-containing protein [Desulfococcaceae bacterium HSG7]|nr:rhodanese-like domain-containing protein [Desulfococcaceae bacterium HSG9]MDM8553231.1 rhodanese-like domain-containing protein [Desulfococcaceae bacterium HSG7]